MVISSQAVPYHHRHGMSILILRHLPTVTFPFGFTHVQSTLPRLSPSLDVLLARRCHLLLDRYRRPPLLHLRLMTAIPVCPCSHFPHMASRAAAALLKTTLVDFMRHNGCPLPNDDDSSCVVGEYHEYYDDDAQNIFDRLFFLAMPLSCVFPGGWATSPMLGKGRGERAPSAGNPVTDKRPPSPPDTSSSKPHMILGMALQALVSGAL